MSLDLSSRLAQPKSTAIVATKRGFCLKSLSNRHSRREQQQKSPVAIQGLGLDLDLDLGLGLELAQRGRFNKLRDVAETPFLIIANRLLNFRLGVHYKWTHLDDFFTDRFTGKQ